MIASGEKKEEYREIKPYWEKTLMNENVDYNAIKFKNGYAKNAPSVMVRFRGIKIGKAKPEWSDNWQGDVFVIKLGNIIHGGE